MLVGVCVRLSCVRLDLGYRMAKREGIFDFDDNWFVVEDDSKGCVFLDVLRSRYCLNSRQVVFVLVVYLWIDKLKAIYWIYSQFLYHPKKKKKKKKKS